MTLRTHRAAILAHVLLPETTQMAMPQTVPWTRKDLDRLPDDANRYEVLEGELLVSPPPSEAHQEILYWLNAVLTPFVVEHGLGRVQFPRGVIVAGGSQLEPDLMVRRFAATRGWENAPVPILVIEVLSKSTRQRDLGSKRAFYVDTGVNEYWAVDRESRAVLRITRAGEQRVVDRFDWSPPDTSAILQIDVALMFQEILGPA